ncbi:MAG TPA: hypothetical protein PLW68_16350 [Casimicrobiaceae bacterium]|nr:hypothetical protein [Casimicrobiaceae bacterium]
MNDLQSTLFWLRLIQVVVAIPLLAIAGQGATSVLTRMMGQPPDKNIFYRLFVLVASPVVKPCRWITPRVIADRHMPMVAFSLLLIAYVWIMFEIASTCIRHGLAVAQCLQSH